MLTKTTALDVEKIRQDFPLLQREIHGQPLAYLDNASTTQKPITVLESMERYYTLYNANIHRGVYQLSEEATAAYEQVRQRVADFIHAAYEEIIFTRGTTESLNLLASSLGKTLKEGDEIILTEMEHHSNLVPWQQLAKEKKLVVKFIPVDAGGRLDLEAARKMITNKTKIVAAVHVSNVLGTINLAEELRALAHHHGALFVVDGAQAVAHLPVDVKALNCDFYAFSGHKMYGPTGIGVLYGKKHLLEQLPPFLFGGDMIREVTFEQSTWNDVPWKFEAGTPNIAGVIGLGMAIEYLKRTGMENIRDYEEELTAYALARLQKVQHVQVYGPSSPQHRAGVLSFNVKGIHSHDLATLLDREGIAVRGGHHCAMPLMRVLNIIGSTRASFGVYNTKEEIDRLIAAIEKAKRVFCL